MRLISALLVSLTIGCGSDGSDPVDPKPDANTTPSDWADLVGRDWTVPPGAFDTYKCTRIKVEQDTWVAGFRATAPQGTHHTVVTISNNSTQVGDYDCSVSSLDAEMLYASGVATDDLLFPEGVAMKISAGQYINLNLHLFNAGDTEITGHSGILIKKIDPAAIVHEADMTFAGKINFSIPPGDNQTISGGCTLQSDWNVFTLWPHMHQYAKHLKMVATPPGGSPITLHDGAYDFVEQTNYPMAAPMLLPEGTQIQVTCTYNNDVMPAQNIDFGDSSNQEMCFAGMYKYPAGGNLFGCTSF